MPNRTRNRRPLTLDNLRGFEAAARRLSFTLAARDLSLTQSSISRQVQGLEEELGKALFVRKTRALELTAAGQKLLRNVRGALADIDRCVDEIRGQSVRRRVSVTTYASFASLWLVPKLTVFARAHPDVDIRIDASDHFVVLEDEGIDIALRHCRADQVPHNAVRLMSEELVPALAPQLLERCGPIRTPADIARQTLLVLEDHSAASADITWTQWFQRAGIKTPTNVPRLVFNFVDQSMQAAVRGQGVVLARTSLLRDFLERGELLTPVDVRLASPYASYLVTNRNTREEPHVRAFCEWLLKYVS